MSHNLLAIGLLLLCCHAHAEKRIAVKLEHSPSLAAALGKRITLGRITGDCGAEFGKLLLADMRARGVTLEAEGSAVDLVPAALLSIDVTRCEAHPLPPILGGGLPAEHISRTEGYFQATVRATDPADGRELAAVTVRGHVQKDNQSQTTTPEYPAPADVKSLTLRQALVEAQHLYMPWFENREIPFADSKECQLNRAYAAAKAGDYDELLKLSQASADACGAGSRVSMEAFYNLGVSYMLARKYDAAIAAFQKAVDLHGARLAAGLLAECSAESALEKARRPPPAQAAPAGNIQTGIVLTNDFVMRLVDGNIATQEILKMIANQPCRFSLEPADLAKLKAAGVPDEVIAAMQHKKSAAMP